MSIKASVIPRSTSQPLLASPAFASRQGYQVSGYASPGGPQVAATYAVPRTYAAAPTQKRAAYPGFPGNSRALQVEALAPTVYAGAPPPSLTYAAPPTWAGNYGREQFIVEPNGQVDRVYASLPPATLTYAAPVQEIIEIVKDDSEAVALRAELQECVALVQEYQRKNGELVQLKNGLEVRLSGCEVRNSELQQQNNSQREEINSLLRRNEELTSLNLALQEKVRALEAQNHKPVHHEKAPPPPAPLPEGSDDDKIEHLIREFISAHPDFPVEVERTKPLWYQFSGPINKKVNFKIVGHNVLARVGGGFEEALKWLKDQRQEFLEAEGIMVEEERQNSSGAGLKGRQLGSQASRSKRNSSASRNAANGR